MSLTVNNCTIRQGEDGLYCLTDMWVSLGKEEKLHPRNFTRLKETKKEIEFLNRADVRSLKTTRGQHSGGTWACKQLVYSYSMWVSAEFKFAVIDAFDALANNELEKAVSIAKTVTKLEMINAHKELIFHDESKSAMDKLNGITANESEYKSTVSDAGSALSKCRGQKADYADKKQTLQNELQLTLSI